MCIVLSTDWHELLLPFSFFAAAAGIYVEDLAGARGVWRCIRES